MPLSPPVFQTQQGGFREAMAATGRINDLAGGTLLLGDLHDWLYQLRTARRADGRSHSTINAFAS